MKDHDIVEVHPRANQPCKYHSKRFRVVDMDPPQKDGYQTVYCQRADLESPMALYHFPASDLVVVRAA